MSTYENNGYTDYYYLGSQLVAKFADPRTQSDEPGYTGHVEDNDLQLTYMQQRYYDPIIGRFYSNDPVGFTASNPMMFNRYAYANNNPYKFVDPDGLEPEFKFEMPSMLLGLPEMFGFDSAAEGNKVTEQAVNSAFEALDDAAPSRETMHTVGTVTSIGLTVASVTTPCTVVCAGAAIAISSTMAVDNFAQGEYVNAGLNLLPAGAGKATSLLFKGTNALSKAQAGAVVDTAISVTDLARPKD